ncbi:cytochrome P450 [Phlebopus sp. FC_14]|nr:cytochrome P450 [Phlebopus sp. FC_14]
MQLDAIPAVGPSGSLSSYFGAVKFIFHAKNMIQEGYAQHKNGFFRIPMMDRWVVVLTGKQLIEELRKIGDDKLSFDHAMQDLLQVKYTFGFEAQTNPYHVTVIKHHLRRNLHEVFSEIYDEVVLTFDHLIPSHKNGWVKVQAYPAVMKATCRISNRIFVGLPICQSAQFEELQLKFALQVMLRASLVNFFPKLLHPIIGRLLINTPSSLKRCMDLLQPVVDERLRNTEQFGSNWPGRPNDLISWLVDVSKPEDRNLRSICLRILVLNFASLHTSAQSFSHALLNLASHPQYLQTLREEVKNVTDRRGWTRESMGQLIKMESFLRESQRINGTSLLPVVRKAMEDIRFSDGTTLPAGTHLAVASIPMYLDDEFYSNASTFDPLRFAPAQEVGEESREKHYLSSTSLCNLAFGLGNRACPGRFFATTMMTAMMAYLVLHYDMKLENGVRPPDEWFQMNCSPNRRAEVMFRRRPA